MKLTWRGFRNVIHRVALLRPILALLGVKKGTVADKVGEGASIVDDALPPAEPGSK